METPRAGFSYTTHAPPTQGRARPGHPYASTVIATLLPLNCANLRDTKKPKFTPCMWCIDKLELFNQLFERARRRAGMYC